jgi:hypothetical protein
VRARTIGVPARKAWGMHLPEPTECPTQTIHANFCRPQAPVGSLAPPSKQGGTGKPERWSERPEQQSLGQRDQQEHFAPRLPVLKSEGFDLKCGVLKTETFLDFPTTNVGEGDVPGLLRRLDRFSGKQIPGFAPFALSHHDQPQGATRLGVVDRQGEHTRAARDTEIGIPEQSRLSRGPFAARTLPGFPLLPPGIDELVALLPADDKAHLAHAETPEPGTVAIAAILRRGAPCAPTAAPLCSTRPPAGACVARLAPFARLHQRRATTWGTALLPTSNRLSPSNPRTLTGGPGRLKTPGRLRAIRRTRLDRTAPHPSRLTLSGFSKTLLSQMHSCVSPRCSSSFRLISAGSHRTSAIRSDSHP